MHAAMVFFLASVREGFPKFFADVAVLEIGSYDVNGTVRTFFDGKRHVGVDLIAGPGVDVVGLGHEVSLPEIFDVVISTECFEHNPFYKETFANMVRHARPGGMVLFTCAATGRAEHGTPRREPESSPGTVKLGWEHYRNLEAGDFTDFPFSDAFGSWRFFSNRIARDLYFVGFKRSEFPPNCEAEFLRIADSLLLYQLQQLMPRPHGADGQGGSPERVNERLSELAAELGATKKDLERQEFELGTARAGLRRLEDVLAHARDRLSEIQNSKSFKLVRLMPSIRKRLAAIARQLGKPS